MTSPLPPHDLATETAQDRIQLSPPDVTESDREALIRAFDTGWIAPLGPEVDRFEDELAAATGRADAAALSSGTSAIHLALLQAGIGPGDLVAVSSLTFVASVNPILYVGAEPVLIDSDPDSWTMDPQRLGEAVATFGDRLKAVVVVDLFGQCADYELITAACSGHDITIIEDAAESLGATYRDRPAGSFGSMAALSFNGNKIITTSGGGALVSDDPTLMERTRHLATQARDPAPHYQHSEIGFNYRLSNLLAGLGRSQLADLERRVDIRRHHNSEYTKGLDQLPGIGFMLEPAHCRSTFWLSAITINPDASGVERERVRRTLDRHGIDSRPVWKPMHLQPLFSDAQSVGGEVAARLFSHGLCLPSGSNLTDVQRHRTIEIIRSVWNE